MGDSMDMKGVVEVNVAPSFLRNLLKIVGKVYLIRSFITLYCCRSLCRIFKVSSEFFAVIGPISDSLKMLKKLRHGKYNFCSSFVSEPFKRLRPKKQLQ